MTHPRRIARASSGALRYVGDLLPIELGADDEPGGEPDGEADVALLFADIERYSEYVAATSDEEALAVLAILEEALTEARRAAGDDQVRTCKRLGDGLMLVLASSSSALDAAVTLLEGFDGRMRRSGRTLRLRVGVHRGMCRRHGHDYFGYHVNAAARVVTAARGNEILATAHALAGVDLEALDLDAEPRGRVHDKGMTAPVAVFAVERATAATRDDAADPAVPADPAEPLALEDLADLPERPSAALCRASKRIARAVPGRARTHLGRRESS